MTWKQLPDANRTKEKAWKALEALGYIDLPEGVHPLYEVGRLVVFENAEEKYDDSAMFYVVATGHKPPLIGRAMVYYVLLRSEEVYQAQDKLEVVAEYRLVGGPLCLAGETISVTLCDVEIDMTAKEVEWDDDEWRYKFQS